MTGSLCPYLHMHGSNQAQEHRALLLLVLTSDFFGAVEPVRGLSRGFWRVQLAGARIARSGFFFFWAYVISGP